MTKNKEFWREQICAQILDLQVGHVGGEAQKNIYIMSQEIGCKSSIPTKDVIYALLKSISYYAIHIQIYAR